MKITTQSRGSSMVVRLAYQAETRFTAGGRYVATFAAKDMTRMMFQQWENDNDMNKLSVYEKETGEYEGMAVKLLELPVDAEIIVVGKCEVQYVTTHTGDKVARNVFTIYDWSYDGWDWKLRNQRLGMADEQLSA